MEKYYETSKCKSKYHNGDYIHFIFINSSFWHMDLDFGSFTGHMKFPYGPHMAHIDSKILLLLDKIKDTLKLFWLLIFAYLWLFSVCLHG